MLGGGIGAALGMVVFRHKVRKKRFLACVPLACALTLALGGGALYVGDYYRADEQALALAEAPSTEGGVAVRAIGNHALAFEPLDPQAKLPPRTRELVIEGGNHAGFGNYGDQAGDNEAGISAAEQQEQTVHAIVQALD